MDKALEAAARAMAHENGDDYDAIPANKTEWTKGRGQFGGRFRDVNEPYKSDYDEMAAAAIRAYEAALPTSPLSRSLEDLAERIEAGEPLPDHAAEIIRDAARRARPLPDMEAEG